MSNPDILSQTEIDKLLASLSGDATPAPPSSQALSGNNALKMSNGNNERPKEDKKGYKLYNFRRPDKFSKEHLRALQDMHKEFSRQLSLLLSTYLRMSVEMEVISVDQLTYDEFIRSMPNHVTIGIVELNPLPGQFLMGLSHEVTTSMVDRMLGGGGYGEIIPRELTDVEESLVRRVFDKFTKTLEDSWRPVIPVQSMLIGLENNYSLIQVATAGEIVALITLEIQISSKHSGLLSLCFPYPMLENVLGQLSTQHIFQAKGILATQEDKQNILEKIANSFVEMRVMFGGTNITMRDFLDLKEGDVLRLDNSVEDNLLVKVNGENKFWARPGSSKNKIAVKIVDSLDKEE